MLTYEEWLHFLKILKASFWTSLFLLIVFYTLDYYHFRYFLFTNPKKEVEIVLKTWAMPIYDRDKEQERIRKKLARG